MSYNTIEQVEREWCPFKHIKRISYLSEQDSQRYQDYLDCEGFDDLIKAGKLLSQFNHIQCNDCVKLINEAFENKPKSEKPTPTEKFVQLIDKVSRASASFSATSIIS